MATKQDITIATMKTDIKYIKKQQDEMHDDLKEFIKLSSKKFARKWTEKAIWGVITFCMTAIGASLLYLVLR